MSNKSRRRANTSGRRVALAAGAVLAGAAIPIAAAGSAWADDSSDKSGTNAPAIPVVATGAPAVEVAGAPAAAHPDVTPLPSVGQLENYGLTAGQALDVWNAEQPGGTAVEVSYDGTVVVNANQGATPDAIATSGAKTNDVAVAIGDGTNASATGSGAVAFDENTAGGNGDNAIATGKDAHSMIENSTGTTATATTYSSVSSEGDIDVTLKANSFDSTAQSSGSSDTTVTATGTSSQAYATSDTANIVGTQTVDTTVTVNGTDAYAKSSTDSGVTVSSTGSNSNVTSVSNTGGTVTAKTGGEIDAENNIGGSSTATGAKTDVTSLTNTNSTVSASGGGEIDAEKNTGGTTVTATGSVGTGSNLIQSTVNALSNTGGTFSASGGADVIATQNTDTSVTGSGTIGTGSNAVRTQVTAFDDVSGTKITNNTITASGGAKADVENDDGITATASGKGTDLTAEHDIDSTAIAKNTALTQGGNTVSGEAYITYATDSSVSATGGGSTAIVTFYDDPNTGQVNPTDATAITNNGSFTQVVTDGVSMTNGLPTP